ncbi:MAG: arsenosugar biosynthesis radical SAM protein ArsS [Vicinamibacterales bacterium]|nr:arsenosugar biosynthesis radical SAM protein ArsS [Vicinamibacterales bacterium]
MALPTLLNTRSPLAAPAAQRAALEALPLPRPFAGAAASAGHARLVPTGTTILQINLGKRCNQACHHCHVDAGPDRTEVMGDAVVEACVDLLAATGIPTLDITGGAPELHPRFRDLVVRARALGRRVIDRCNLTITTLPNYAGLPAFLAEHQVEVIASLPSYAATQTDRQRGDGVFEQSVQALRAFNALGYGREGSGLVLNLVTNPVGAFLPASQATLERDWKRELKRRYEIEFNALYTITNMPISRYLEWLEQSGNLDAYMTKLVQAFNPAAVEGLMCRYTLSVGWDGRLFDCDFNQMLDLPVEPSAPQTIFDLADTARLDTRTIVTAPHCFGCTAGAGSSCGGATT